MFQLFRSREKSVRYLLGAVLLFVAFTLVYTLAPTGGMGNPQMNEQVIAEIGDEKLTDMEVRQALQLRMRDRSIPPEMAEFYIPVFVNQMVQDRALSYEARKMGFQVTDKEVAATLQSLFPQLYEGGKFAGHDVYERMVQSQGMTIQEFETNVRNQLLMNRIEMLALEGVVVTPAEVEAEFRRRSEKLKIAYFQISADSLKSKIQVTPAEIQEHFNRNKASYRVPEKKSYLMFVVDEDKVANSITVPEAELRRAYEARKDQYRMAERVKVRHILLKTTDKTPDEVAKIEKRMQDILKQARSGADFAELARKNSEDTGSAAQGGEVGWVVRGQMVPEFEKAAFTTKPGAISDIVKTVYGFHILKVEAKEDAHVKPFEEVRAELAKDLSSSQVSARAQSLADGVRAALIKSPQEAEKFAEANGIKVVHAEKLADADPLPEVGVNADVQDAVSKLPKNGISNVVQAGGKWIVVQVQDVIPARAAELSDVEAQVRSAALAEKADKAFRQQLEEVRKKLQEPNPDFVKLAREFGAEIKNPPEFSREGAVEGAGPATMMEEGFRKNVGQVFGPVQISGAQAFVCKVVAKTPADLTQLAAQRDSIVQSIKSKKAKERRDLFADGVLKSLISQKKVKINSEAVQRLAASYRRA